MIAALSPSSGGLIEAIMPTNRQERTMTKKPITLECCCCGQPAGKFLQHWSREPGYGICPRCALKQTKDGEDMREMYGAEGINYTLPKNM